MTPVPYQIIERFPRSGYRVEQTEIILEGHLYPDETFAEGPFGDFTGYYGRPSGGRLYPQKNAPSRSAFNPSGGNFYRTNDRNAR